ncbi:hypothetical protein CPB86DRAFT_778862, partial [Serendipita vermifera]
MEQHQGDSVPTSPAARPLLGQWTSSVTTPGHEQDRSLDAKYAKNESQDTRTPPPKWVPKPLRTGLTVFVIVFMLALAIIVEVLLAVCQKQNGFHFRGIEQPGASNFLRSFVPVLITVPLTQYWVRSNEDVLRLHPYVIASQGNAPAQTTVLLDYLGLGKRRSFFKAIKFRHGIILTSIFITLLTLLFQPLTAGLFLIRPTQFEFWSNVNMVSVLGLRPDYSDLNAFAAAAGYAQAAAMHGLGDPPFVWEGFSMPSINVSTIHTEISKNGTVFVKSVATQTDPRCVAANVGPIIQQANGSYVFEGSYNGCKATVVSDPNAREHFGVLLVDGCNVNGVEPEDRFKPIMFWFFSPSLPAASMVFCSPVVEIYSVMANISIVDNVLQNVQVLERWDGVSNVTSGAPLNGLALNGMFFGTPADQFIAARNTVIQSCLPGSIFRLANDKVGIDSAIRTGLLEWTVDRYQQYLAMSAQSNYFMQIDQGAPARFVVYQLRLWLDPYITHIFAGVFAFTALLAAIFAVVHARKRRALYLAGPVGTIASAISLTNRSRFGEQLTPLDTEEDMEKKLGGLKFGFNKSTWQIEAHGDHA